jgi:sporulation protein YlmC with PRC-barrel domain
MIDGPCYKRSVSRWEASGGMAESAETPNVGGGWRASALLRRIVVHLERVELVGEVADVVFDTQSRTIAGILIGPAGAEGSMMDALRRLTGGTLGLTYVAAEDIVALDGEIVMIRPRPARRREPGHQPSLRRARGLSVVSMYGRRLGRFADLLLDAEGRAITAYILDAMPSPQRVSGAHAPKQDTKQTEPLVIPAAAYLRVGRDLIALSDRPLQDEATPLAAHQPGAAEWPGEPRAMSFASDTPRLPVEHGVGSPDAPTKELRGR